MAKLTGPLMSLDASGSVAGTLTFAKWKGRNYVRHLVKPANPKTPAQTAFRAMMKFLSQAWASINPSDQASWHTLAEQTKISDFNGYVQQNQRDWTQTLVPRQNSNPNRTGTPAVITAASAVGGVRQIELSIPEAGGATAWGTIIYRNDTTGFTPTQNDVIAVFPTGGSGTWKYVDSPLVPGTYFYRFSTFTTQGVELLDATEVSGTAT